MKNIKKYTCLLVCVLAVALTSCRDNQWDDHNQITEQGVGNNLLEAIKANPEWSGFYEALVKTSLDTLLMQSNNFTVFVPVNSAWQNVNTSNLSTLKRLVSNHIAYEKRLNTGPLQASPLYMLNGKYVKYDSLAQTYNGAKITSADNVAANGVLHVTDKPLEVRNNIWDYVSSLSGTTYYQVAYLKSLGHKEMDMSRSVDTGVNSSGQLLYDTAWVSVNDFLKEVPLNDESKEYTYVVMQDNGFYALCDKFYKYFYKTKASEKEALTFFSICKDMTFNGIVDITQHDTLVNISDVKVAVKGVQVIASYNASNGRVYVLDAAKIRVRDKIKPVVVEGENFTNASSVGHIYTRYKPEWASGARDIMLSCSTVQSDSVRSVNAAGRDTVTFQTTTFQYSGDNLVNTVQFWIEYKANIYSADYEIYYVAHNDISGHKNNSRGQTMRLEQKLFVSFPGKKALANNTASGKEAQIVNNALGNLRCFVGQDTAGLHKETKLRQWNLLDDAGQTLSSPVTSADAAVLKLSGGAGDVGQITMRLCNTPRLASDGKMLAGTKCGMLFLDYIKLVPKFAAGED